jgi:Flp pilus assembly protein TadG
MLGLVGFSVDVGTLLRAKRVMQSAADSAAIAGAAELSFGDVTAAARADAALNGVTNGASGTTVTVNNGPASGPNAGNAKYVEVIVSQSQPTFFMRLLNHSSMMVSARAVAASVPNTACIYTLSPNPASGSGVSVSGSAVLALTCSILDDATGSSALSVTGGATIQATGIGVVGGDAIHVGGIVNPASVNGMVPVSDPLSSVTPPPASDYNTGCLADPAITTNRTLGPSTPGGFVCYNGLSFPKGSPTITLNPGLYIISGSNPLSVASGTTINGTGVSFYFVNGASFAISNGATLNLTAPTSGPDSGILFYEDRNDTAADSFVGGSAGSLNGIFYLPAANLSLQNGNSSTFNVDLVVGSLAITGGATLHPFAPLNASSPLSSPLLVE